MRFPKKTPGEGATGRASWSFESWKGGGYEAGWLGGDVVWLDTHHDGVTKPCHSFLTGGLMECPHCAAKREVVERGYVPWIGATGKPLCSLIAKTLKPLTELIRRHDPIVVGKGRSKYKPVYVRPRANCEKWVPTPGTETTAEEFETWLLHLWGVAALIEFFCGDNGLSPAAPAAPAAPDPGRRGRAPEYTPEQERELIRGCLPVRPPADAAAEPGPMEDAFPRLRAMVNGKGKKHE